MELLKGEGDSKLTMSIRHRRGCDNCGEHATKRITYCLEDARRNPASSAYKQDDISWCADSQAYSCDICESEVKRSCCPDGMKWTATFQASDRFASMFLHWVEREPTKGELTEILENFN